MAAKVKLSVGEQIDRARDGRTQTWIVNKMKELGVDIDEVRFSRKKKGHEEFSEKEIQVLSEILGTQITIS